MHPNKLLLGLFTITPYLLPHHSHSLPTVNLKGAV